MKKRIRVEKNKQYAVLGLGKFGIEMVKSLIENDCEVLAVDKDAERVNSIVGIATHSVTADVSDEKVLKELDIADFDIVIIGIGSDMQASVVSALLCKELGVKCVIAKATTAQHETILKKIGADRIIIPEADSARTLTQTLLYPSLSQIIELDGGFSIAEITVPSIWNDKMLSELKIRNKYKVNILLILSDEGSVIPSGETKLFSGTRVIVGASVQDINYLLEKITEKSI